MVSSPAGSVNGKPAKGTRICRKPRQSAPKRHRRDDLTSHRINVQLTIDPKQRFIEMAAVIFHVPVRGRNGTIDHQNHGDISGMLELGDFHFGGDLLFTRWIDNGQEYRENWGIAINDNTMDWSALRLYDDGTSHVVSFEMTKVN